MFSQASVCPGGVSQHEFGWGCVFQQAPGQGVYTRVTATAADAMRPTGMHSS